MGKDDEGNVDQIVGQSRLPYIENSFLEEGRLVRQMRDGAGSSSEELIIEICSPNLLSRLRQKSSFFARRYSLPVDPVSFFDQRCVDVGLGNTSFRLIHAGQATSGSVI